MGGGGEQGGVFFAALSYPLPPCGVSRPFFGAAHIVSVLFNKTTKRKIHLRSLPYMCRSTIIIMKIIYGLSHPGDVLGA